jgi:hypothetical protein
VITPPTAGEDCRSLHLTVAAVARVLNSITGMTVMLEGKSRGIGSIHILGDKSVLRIHTNPKPAGPSVATTVSVASSANPSDSGAAITFTATVSPSAATGTVQFKIDGAAFGSPVTLVNGSATSGSTSALTIGEHTITAEYSGDSTYFASSGTLKQNVRDATTLTLTSSSNPSAVNQPVHFSAVLSVSTATGTIQFKIDGVAFGSPVTLVNGAATSLSTTAIAAGTHTISADYSGDNSHAATSNSLTQTVNAMPANFTVTKISGFDGSGNMFDGVQATFAIAAAGSWTGDVVINTNDFGAPFMTEFAFGGAIKWSGIPSVSFNAGIFRLTAGSGQFKVIVRGAVGTNYVGGEFASGTINFSVRSPYDNSTPTINSLAFLTENFV